MSGKTYTIAQFGEALKRLEKTARGKALKRSAMAGGFVIEAEAKINVNDTFNPGTGNLAGSIFTDTVHESDTLVETATGPSVIYGRIQELGGTVKPVFAKYLAIPINARKDSSPWDYPDLIFIPMDNSSSAMLISKSGVAMFWLTKSVTLPARPYLRPAADENGDRIVKAISENLRIEIEAAL